MADYYLYKKNILLCLFFFWSAKSHPYSNVTLGDVSNIDHVITMQCSAGKLWVPLSGLLFSWSPFVNVIQPVLFMSVGHFSNYSTDVRDGAEVLLKFSHV